MKVSQPTKLEREWRELVRTLNCLVCGFPAEIHHAVGRTAKHNKVAIGHWWLLPLCTTHHKGLHAGDTYGYTSRKDFEKQGFAEVDLRVGLTMSPSQDVYDAIMDYHR